MNQLGLLDAIMTDDGDALVFGAQVVIRKLVIVPVYHRIITDFPAAQPVSQTRTMSPFSLRRPSKTQTRFSLLEAASYF